MRLGNRTRSPGRIAIVGVLLGSACGVPGSEVAEFEGAAARSSTPIVVAHRGAIRAAPENSMAAIAHALDQGGKWIEVDIRETSDAHLILFHDDSLERMLGECGRVSTSTWAELRDRPLLHSDHTEATIPLAFPAIESIQQRATALVELKGEIDETTLADFFFALSRLPRPDRVIIAIREARHIPIIRKHGPELRIGAYFSPVMLSSLVRGLKHDIDVLLIHWTLGFPAVIDRAHANGQLAILTSASVRSVDLRERAENLGADGYFVTW